LLVVVVAVQQQIVGLVLVLVLVDTALETLQ
jgi:hypothetical protein